MTAPVTETPTIGDLIAAIAAGDRSAEMGPIPSKVVAYDQATQTCDAQPLVMVPQGGELRAVPIIRQVQVAWPSGAGWSIVGPMAVGDLVWLIPAGADIGQWKVSAAPSSPAATTRRFHPSDMIAIPGSRPICAPLPSTAYDPYCLVLSCGHVKIGDSSATKPVVLNGDSVFGTTDFLVWLNGVEAKVAGLLATPPVPWVGAIATAASSASKAFAI